MLETKIANLLNSGSEEDFVNEYYNPNPEYFGLKHAAGKASKYISEGQLKTQIPKWFDRLKSYVKSPNDDVRQRATEDLEYFRKVILDERYQKQITKMLGDSKGYGGCFIGLTAFAASASTLGFLVYKFLEQ